MYVELEVSKLQDKAKKDRGRSPDRGRDRDSSKRNDGHGQRDEYRSSNRSPRRNSYNNSRKDDYGRDRGYQEKGRRGRSRSPDYGRNSNNSYRRRSPSPQSRPKSGSEDLDLPPRRYGSDVPDVQIILQPDLNRDFVNWVENALKAKNLKTNVMYLHPRFPKDQVIQRQAAEGVHAVIDLDLRSQSISKIPVQAFDRSAGASSVRFDQYVDLDPSTAAEVILRAKASAVPSYGAPSYANTGNYSASYQSQPPQQSYQPPQQPAYHQPQQQAPINVANIAGLLGNVDNNTLQSILSTIQSTQGTHGGNNFGAVNNSQIDINAILGSLGQNAAGAQVPQAQPQYGGNTYGQPQPQPGNQGASGGHDQNAQVQNIMSQLARFRQ